MDATQLQQANLEDLKPRERILKTALDLFNELGPNKTGTDLIIEKSGVAKMTFFRQFKTKNQLIAEILKIKDDESIELLKKFSLDSKKEGIEKALGIFDGLKAWFSQPNFNGCPFIRGLYDFPFDDEKEIVKNVDSHFERINKLIDQLLAPLKLKDHKEIAAQFQTLMMGAIVMAQTTKSNKAAVLAKEQARQLLSK